MFSPNLLWFRRLVISLVFVMLEMGATQGMPVAEGHAGQQHTHVNEHVKHKLAHKQLMKIKTNHLIFTSLDKEK